MSKRSDKEYHPDSQFVDYSYSSMADPTRHIMRSLYRIAGLAVIALSLGTVSGCGNNDNPQVLVEPKFVAEGVLAFHRPSGEKIVTIAIELAETPEEQEMGLMNRRSLPDRGGMLFVTNGEGERTRSFWMKNTPLPLDIIFVRADSTIANIVKRTTPLSEDFIESDGIVQTVLEVRAGFTDRYGIDTTTTISWQRREDVKTSTDE